MVTLVLIVLLVKSAFIGSVVRGLLQVFCSDAGPTGRTSYGANHGLIEDVGIYPYEFSMWAHYGAFFIAALDIVLAVIASTANWPIGWEVIQWISYIWLGALWVFILLNGINLWVKRVEIFEKLYPYSQERTYRQLWQWYVMVGKNYYKVPPMSWLMTILEFAEHASVKFLGETLHRVPGLGIR